MAKVFARCRLIGGGCVENGAALHERRLPERRLLGVVVMRHARGGHRVVVRSQLVLAIAVGDALVNGSAVVVVVVVVVAVAVATAREQVLLEAVLLAEARQTWRLSLDERLQVGVRHALARLARSQNGQHDECVAEEDNYDRYEHDENDVDDGDDEVFAREFLVDVAVLVGR